MAIRPAAEKLKIEMISPGVGIPAPMIKSIIESNRPTALLALTSYADRLALDLRNLGCDVKGSTIKKIIVSAEPSSKSKRERIAEEYGGAGVFDLYASTEVLIMAYECGAHDGMHVPEDYLLVCTRDPKTGEFLSEGEEGLDSVTTLVSPREFLGMVLINYQHGDKFSIVSEEECECGRTHKRISHPTRADETLIISGAKLNPMEIESILYKPIYKEFLTGDYRIISEMGEGRIYKLTVRIEAKDNADKIPEEYIKKIRSDIFTVNYPLYNEVSGGRIELVLERYDRGKLDVGLEKYQKRKPIKVINLLG